MPCRAIVKPALPRGWTITSASRFGRTSSSRRWIGRARKSRGCRWFSVRENLGFCQGQKPLRPRRRYRAAFSRFLGRWIVRRLTERFDLGRDLAPEGVGLCQDDGAALGDLGCARGPVFLRNPGQVIEIIEED